MYFSTYLIPHTDFLFFYDIGAVSIVNEVLISSNKKLIAPASDVDALDSVADNIIPIEQVTTIRTMSNKTDSSQTPLEISLIQHNAIEKNEMGRDVQDVTVGKKDYIIIPTKV